MSKIAISETAAVADEIILSSSPSEETLQQFYLNISQSSVKAEQLQTAKALV